MAIRTAVRPVPDRHPSVRRQQRQCHGALYCSAPTNWGATCSRLVLGDAHLVTIGLVSVALSLVLGCAGRHLGLYAAWSIRHPAGDRDFCVNPHHSAVDGPRPPRSRQAWSPEHVYFAITIISLIGWTNGARRARPVLALREEDFIVAAELPARRACASSSSTWCRRFCRISSPRPARLAGDDHQRKRRCLPRPRPAPAGDLLGVILSGCPEPGDTSACASGADRRGAVIIVILAFNFLGDGLRDAADPYG